jgi:hypothetical protein
MIFYIPALLTSYFYTQTFEINKGRIHMWIDDDIFYFKYGADSRGFQPSLLRQIKVKSTQQISFEQSFAQTF